MDDCAKWEFNCPQYVDFRKPLDDDDDADLFFEIDHEDHIKGILKKRNDKSVIVNKENVGPSQSIVSRKQSEESVTSCEYITPPSHLSAENKSFEDIHSLNNPEWKCALFSINENESEFKNELNNEIKSSNDNQKNLIKLKNSEKKKHSSHSKFSSKIPKLQKNIKCLHHNNVEEKQSHSIHDINITKNTHVTLKINIQQKNSNLKDPIIKIKDPLNSKVILKKNKENQIKCSIIQNRNVLQTKNQNLTKRPIEKNILRNKNAQIINKENISGKSVQQNVMKKEMIKNTSKQNLSNKSKLQNAAVKNLQSTKLNIMNSTQQIFQRENFYKKMIQKILERIIYNRITQTKKLCKGRIRKM
ncbi:arrestin domain-containing protein F-like [Centruroides vittatus]|uniref:arrestin domain-containing protein F-like n=1 Tax=Centruroides vittatus TaxID=120091 RepID=UPI00350F9552